MRRLIRSLFVLALVAGLSLALGGSTLKSTLFPGGAGGSSVGLRASLATHLPTYEGGADSLTIRVRGDFGLPVTLKVDYMLSKTEGVHPTENSSWYTIITLPEQEPSFKHRHAIGLDVFTARGDTVFVKTETYLVGELVDTQTDTLYSPADYWRWWNYAFAAVVTMDDAFAASLVQADSLFAAHGKRFSSYYNPVWLHSRVPQICSPVILAALYEGGNFELGGHGLTHGALYNSTARGSRNDGGYVSAADTLAATNWDDFRAIWTGDYSTSGLQRYFEPGMSPGDPGIYYNNDTDELELSGMTLWEHFLAEISRDSLQAFTGIPKAEQRTFAYPHYTHNVEILAQLEAEGYIGARGSFDNSGNPWGDLAKSPKNEWGAISLYRVPLLHTANSVFEPKADESTTKTRIRAAMGAKNVRATGGLWPILTHSMNPTDYPTQWTRPEEIAWWMQCMADSGGIVVSFGDAVAYYRERATHAHLTTAGDRVYTIGAPEPEVEVAVWTTTTTARNQGSGHNWPTERDLTFHEHYITLVSPATGADSTSHVTNTGPLWQTRINTGYRNARSGTPRHTWLHAEFADLLEHVEIDSVISAKFRFRVYPTGSHWQTFVNGDTLSVVVSHLASDRGWLDGPVVQEDSGDFIYWNTRNASWVRMDVDDESSAWTPSLNLRIFDRSWGSWVHYSGGKSFAQGAWDEFDITAGVRKILQQGAPNGGVYVFGRTPVAGNDQYFSWQSDNSNATAAVGARPWFEVRYLRRLEHYGELVDGGENIKIVRPQDVPDLP